MRIQLRYKNTAAEWESSDVVLAKGEPALAIDTGEIRFGNGTDTWTNLPAPFGGVQSVAGKTGAVYLTPQDVELNNVDNTADIAKPVSAATAAAISALQQTIEDLQARVTALEAQ